MRASVSPDGDTQHPGEPLGPRRAERRSKANEVYRVAGATVDTEERGDRARTNSTGAPEHLRWNYPGSATTLDRKAMEGYLRVSEWRGRFSQPDGQLHQRLIYPPSGFEGWIRSRGLLECYVV